ncbi:MAG: TlpA family protein disulfide reductase [Lentisphaeria bacterium]|nr:TlpA family protein disulfide reductase [Lentisphaeria bacterium]
MIYLKTISLYLFCGLFLCFADPTQEDTELEKFKKLGKIFGTMNSNGLGLNDEEKEAFIAGFAEGVKEEKLTEEEKAEVRKLGAYAISRKEKVRLERLDKLQVPMNVTIQSSEGEETTLAELVKGKKAILIDFWASWCKPCMQIMPNLKQIEKKLAPQGIVTIGMNIEEIEVAAAVKKYMQIEFGWYVEPKGDPFTDLLDIKSYPRILLVSPEGKVLYNDHPMKPALNTAIAKLGATL